MLVTQAPSELLWETRAWSLHSWSDQAKSFYFVWVFQFFPPSVYMSRYWYSTTSCPRIDMSCEVIWSLMSITISLVLFTFKIRWVLRTHTTENHLLMLYINSTHAGQQLSVLLFSGAVTLLCWTNHYWPTFLNMEQPVEITWHDTDILKVSLAALVWHYHPSPKQDAQWVNSILFI